MSIQTQEAKRLAELDLHDMATATPLETRGSSVAGTLPKAPHLIAHEDSANDAIAATLFAPQSGRRRLTLATVTAICFALVIVAGLVVWGWGYTHEQNNPGFWHVSLVSMLFWLSITQGMFALSAVLRVTHASWRYSLNRLLDISSLFGVWVVALLPFLILARNRIYALSSVSFHDNVWRVAAPVVWDALAVGIAYISGWLLLYLIALPDFAILADRARPGSKRAKFYRRVSFHWVGEMRQWATLRRAEGVLVGGILGSFVASQTILGWDFQLAAARDWDSSIFAPLYTLGSLFGAVAMIILVGTVSQRLIQGQAIMQPRQYDALARMSLAFGLIWFYFRWCDYLTAWYEHIPSEWAIQGNRVGAFPIFTGLMILGCFVIPVFANFFKPIRQSPVMQCIIALCILSGIAIQRYLDTVPTFAPNYPASALYPTIGSAFVFIGIAAMFVLTYLLAARYIPMVSWWGTGKEMTRTEARQLGNGSVTVMVEDPPLWET